MGIVNLTGSSVASLLSTAAVTGRFAGDRYDRDASSDGRATRHRNVDVVFRFAHDSPLEEPDSNSPSHPLTRRQTHGSDRMNGAERDTVVGSGSLVTLDPGATKREIARSFPVRPWALSQARGA